MLRRSSKKVQEEQPSAMQAEVISNGTFEAVKVTSTQEAEPKGDLLVVKKVDVELVSEDEELSKFLNDEERQRLAILERQIVESFYIAGSSLREIRDQRLYRESHDTFEAYCEDRFGYGRRLAYYYIDAANVVDNLRECEQSVHILPTSEYQCRPLARVEATLQPNVWCKAVDKAGGKAPSHELVKETVKEFVAQVPPRKGKHLARPSIGDICIIKQNNNSRLMDRIGYWAIVKEVNELGCTVQLYDRTVEGVDLQDISSFGYEDKQIKAMYKLCEQLNTISHAEKEEYEEISSRLLEFFGKLKRSTLTKLEQKIIGVFEREAKTRSISNAKENGKGSEGQE